MVIILFVLVVLFVILAVGLYTYNKYATTNSNTDMKLAVELPLPTIEGQWRNDEIDQTITFKKVNTEFNIISSGGTVTKLYKLNDNIYTNDASIFGVTLSMAYELVDKDTMHIYIRACPYTEECPKTNPVIYHRKI